MFSERSSASDPAASNTADEPRESATATAAANVVSGTDFSLNGSC